MTSLQIPKYFLFTGYPGPGDIIILSGLIILMFSNVNSSFLLTIMLNCSDMKSLLRISPQYWYKLKVKES